MTYLICSSVNDFSIKEVQDYEKMLGLLRQYTAYWCASDDYMEDNEDFEVLFNECLKNKNFGDIAQVYQIDTYFKTSSKKYPCGLYLADKNTKFTMTRIF